MRGRKEQAGRQSHPAMDADMLYSNILSLQPSLPGDPMPGEKGDAAAEDAAAIETEEAGRGRFRDDVQYDVDIASPRAYTPRRQSRSRSPQKCSKRAALRPVPDLQRSGPASADCPVLRTPTAQLKAVRNTIEDHADGDASSSADFSTPRSTTFVSTPVLSAAPKASMQRICGGSPFHSPEKKGLPKGTLALAAAGVIPRAFLEAKAMAGAQV